MSWEKLDAGSRSGASEPYVSITKNNITFSAGLTKQTGLGNMKSVGVYVDEAEKKIAFDFSETTKPGNYKVTTRNAEGKMKPITVPLSQVKGYDWIKVGRYEATEEDDMLTVEF